MAVVATLTRKSVVSDRLMWEGVLTFTGATSYVTGGITTVPSDYGFNVLDNIEVMSSTVTSFINQTPVGTFKVILTGGHPSATEVANAGDPTGKSVYVRAYGW
jgi:hypothetical protein